MDGLGHYLLTVILLPAALAVAIVAAARFGPWRGATPFLRAAACAAVGAALLAAFVREVDAGSAWRAAFGSTDPAMPAERWHSLGAFAAMLLVAAPAASAAESRLSGRGWSGIAAIALAAALPCGLLRFPGDDAATVIATGAAVLAGACAMSRMPAPAALASSAAALLLIGAMSAGSGFPSLGAIAAATGIALGATAGLVRIPCGASLAAALAAAVAVVAWCGGAYADGSIPWWAFPAIAAGVPLACLGAAAARRRLRRTPAPT